MVLANDRQQNRTIWPARYLSHGWHCSCLWTAPARPSTRYPAKGRSRSASEATHDAVVSGHAASARSQHNFNLRVLLGRPGRSTGFQALLGL